MEHGLTRMHVREANVPDATAIAKVQVESWRTTYTGVVPDEYLAQRSYEQHGQVWRNTLSTHGATEFVFVAQAEASNIIGFASGGPERSGNIVYKGELYAIYLLEGYQREGIGGQLVQTIAKRLMQEGLHSTPKRAVYTV